ncbi:MAG: thioredoxin family protein [Betaproteobacteria bacterium]|nr:thioredoxin family protein [Betaproteobacteria bacterium]
MNKIARNILAATALLASSLLAQAAGPLYPDIARAGADIEAAQKEAKQSHKRVIVDFGGDWCGDCKVLDINFKKPENEAVLKAHFILVHVNVGEKGITENFAVGERFGIPLKKGVPALAVLDSDGKLLYSQKNGEFENMRKMDPQSVNEFLKKWQGAGS